MQGRHHRRPLGRARMHSRLLRRRTTSSSSAPRVQVHLGGPGRCRDNTLVTDVEDRSNLYSSVGHRPAVRQAAGAVGHPGPRPPPRPPAGSHAGTPDTRVTQCGPLSSKASAMLPASSSTARTWEARWSRVYTWSSGGPAADQGDRGRGTGSGPDPTRSRSGRRPAGRAIADPHWECGGHNSTGACPGSTDALCQRGTGAMSTRTGALTRHAHQHPAAGSISSAAMNSASP